MSARELSRDDEACEQTKLPVPAWQTRADFDRIAALDDGAWDHNRHYHAFLLDQLPATLRQTALEVGCGTGAFARSLAQRFRRVQAIDLSAAMIRRARALSAEFENLEFRQADIGTYPLPPATLDCVTSIATLHHLVLEEVLPRLAGALRPGGVLLVLDLYGPRTLLDHLWSAAALPASLTLRLWKLGRLRDPARVRRAWAAHAAHDRYPDLAAVTRIAQRVLPGACVRRHLFWRYSLVWRRPGS